MTINFPNSPSNGQQLTSGGKTYTYNSSKAAWKINSFHKSVINVKTQNTLDSAGINTILSTSNDVLDSSEVISLMGTNSTKVYTVSNMDALGAVTGMIIGNQALVTSTNKIFMYNGTGWYLIATITNGAPSAISNVDSAYAFASGSPIIVNAIATDPEGLPLTWSSTTSGLGNIATIAQGTGDSSNYFTITPSTNDSDAGTFTLTIAATDNVNGAVNFPASFTLAFATDWSSTTQNTELNPTSGTSSAQGGYSTSIRGEMAVVGAPGYSSGTGRIFIYERGSGSAPNWSLVSGGSLSPQNGNNNHNFGEDVSLTPDISSSSFSNSSPYWLVAGQPNLNSGSGRVTVYRYDGSNWNTHVNIPNNTTGIAGRFGKYVEYDPSGERIFVGAPFDNSNQGKVYIYKGSGSNASRSFSEETTLTASDGGSSDLFGSTIASNQDGSIIAVGAWAYDYDATPMRKGGVYIFTRSGTSWTQRAILQASDGARNDYFGTSLDLNETGDFLVVGAPNNDTGGGDSGKVYVFKTSNSGVSWTEIQKIQPSDIAAGDQFGFKVAASGDSFIASSRENAATVSGNATGAAYLFSRTGVDEYTQSKKIVSGDIVDGDRFGWSVDMDSYNIIVGARDHDDPTSGSSGSGNAYIFEK